MTAERLHILMIDDNAGDTALAQRAFARIQDGFGALSIARDGEEGLAMLRRQGCFNEAKRPDLVLLDMRMPKIDGKAVLAAIKADPELRDIPVLVATTSREGADIFDAFSLKADGYFVKPLVLDETYRSYFREIIRSKINTTSSTS